MKTLIAAAVIAFASTGAVAQTFQYERDIGSEDLFPSLTAEGQGKSSANYTAVFDYERSVGTPNLFPSLNGDGYVPNSVKRQGTADSNIIWRDVAAQEADQSG